MSGMLIRPCQAHDLDQVLALERQSFKDPYSRSDFQWCLTRACIFTVACDGPSVIGYVLITVEASQGHIASMAVSPVRRRQGIGSAILGAAIQSLAADGVGRIYLEVRRSNSDAIGLYRKFSFAATGEVKRHYYPDGEDAIVMARGPS